MLMAKWLLLFDTIFVFIRVGLIIAICLLLYRALRLDTLPWIASQYGVSFVAREIGSYYYRRLTPSSITPGQLLPAPLQALGMTSALLVDVSKLLLLLLIFSEAAFTLQRAYPEVRSRLLRFLVAAHSRVRLIGLIAVLLAAIEPLFPIVYYYTRELR
jgi:hypothetical protein